MSKENLPGYHPGVPATVLIVDDEKNIQVTLARALSLEGYRTEAAGTGQEALDWLRSHTPQLLLLDLHLPDMSGWDLLKTIREDTPHHAVPVIAVSAELPRDTPEAMGLDDYWSKPIELVRVLPVLDRLCSHFVITLTLAQGPRAALRRDWGSVLALVGRHLVWPPAVLARLRAFLARRCPRNSAWRGHDTLSDAAFLERHGVWRGPYEDGSLFFYLDDFLKDEPKDLLTVLRATGDWLGRSLQREHALVQRNIDALAGLLQLNPAERALLLYGTLARYQRDLRGLLVEFKVSSAQEAYAVIAEVAGVDEREVAEALKGVPQRELQPPAEGLVQVGGNWFYEEFAGDLAIARIGLAAPEAGASAPEGAASDPVKGY